MPHLPLTDVVVPDNRIRREFDDYEIKKLADSIRRLGLLNPITLRADGRTLLAGERRLRALQILQAGGGCDVETGGSICNYCKEQGETCAFPGGNPFSLRYPEDADPAGELAIGMVPFTYASDLSEPELLEAELEENTHRQDLTWQEHAAAVKRLHDFRTAQYGEYSPANPGGWSATATATELRGRPAQGAAVSAVTEMLNLAEYLDDPEVAAAADPKQAMKIVKREAARADVRARAEGFDPTKTPHILHLGDAKDLSTLVEPESVDVILTDPPYGINVDKHGFENIHDYDDSQDSFESLMSETISLLYSAAKPQAHAYIFCDIRRFFFLESEMLLAGWKVWPRPFIWDKGNVGSFGAADQGPRHVYDCILYANKGKKPCTAMYRDVISVPSIPSAHPAAKPRGLYVDLLRRSAKPGDTVLDPFAGGGVIFTAATELNCRAIGIELNPDYHAIAQATLTNLIEGKK